MALMRLSGSTQRESPPAGPQLTGAHIGCRLRRRPESPTPIQPHTATILCKPPAHIHVQEPPPSPKHGRHDTTQHAFHAAQSSLEALREGREKIPGRQLTVDRAARRRPPPLAANSTRERRRGQEERRMPPRPYVSTQVPQVFTVQYSELPRGCTVRRHAPTVTASQQDRMVEHGSQLRSSLHLVCTRAATRSAAVDGRGLAPIVIPPEEPWSEPASGPGPAPPSPPKILMDIHAPQSSPISVRGNLQPQRMGALIPLSTLLSKRQPNR